MYIDLLKSVNVDGWTLRLVTMNLQNGISVYGFFKHVASKENEYIQDIKVRLSNHKARSNSSHSAIDLRDPKSPEKIEVYLQERSKVINKIGRCTAVSPI